MSRLIKNEKWGKGKQGMGKRLHGREFLKRYFIALELSNASLLFRGNKFRIFKCRSVSS